MCALVKRLLPSLLILVLAACATQPAQQRDWPWPEDPWVASDGGRQAEPGSVSRSDESVARPSPDTLLAASDVGNSLVRDARQARARGDTAAAVQSLERAISITPRDPVVWFELARVRLQEEKWAAAENVAQRALEYTYDGDAVVPWCWELIARSREARGDVSGAREARAQARVRG